MSRRTCYLLAVVLVLVAADAWWLYRDNVETAVVVDTVDASDAADNRAPQGAANNRLRRATPESIPPWEATPENTPELAQGHTPAWEVEDPRPTPRPIPPTPQLPPDPIAHPPPMHSPTGVNGDRPPR